MTNRLEEPILDNGTRFVNFFEGRILTGRDLSAQQAAERRQRLRLGRALGAGIVHGLEVTLDTTAGSAVAPVLAIAPGLAVSREGEALELATTKRLELTRALSEAGGGRADLFGPCVNQAPGEQLPAGVGIYLLTLGPASDFEEEAPKAGLGAGGVADGCGRRYATLGVQFRLLRIDPAAPGGASPAIAAEIAPLLGETGTTALSRLRNLLTHRLLGTEETAAFAADPFAASGGTSAFASYGMLDALGSGAEPLLPACEVPLAALYWTLAGVGFLDPWAVRRRRGAMPVDAAWPLVHSARRAAEAEAMLFQFEAQLGWLQSALATAGGPVATRDFRFLPPAGLLRMPSAAAFFAGLTVEGPLDLARARLLAVLETASTYPALDLASDPLPGIRLFRVGGAADWLLYADARIPSAEAQAIRAAALEARIAALEAEIAAPGLIRGHVAIRFEFGGQIRIIPLPNATVTATAADGTETSTVTDGSGRYELSLTPGTYSVETAGLAPHTGLVVTRGGELVEDLIRSGGFS